MLILCCTRRYCYTYVRRRMMMDGKRNLCRVLFRRSTRPLRINRSPRARRDKCCCPRVYFHHFVRTYLSTRGRRPPLMKRTARRMCVRGPSVSNENTLSLNRRVYLPAECVSSGDVSAQLYYFTRPVRIRN